jgi:hypothetical protein
MVELDRRLRRAAPQGAEDSEESGTRTTLKKAPGGEKDAHHDAVVRRKADPEPAWPAVALGEDHPTMAPIPPGVGSGEQPEAGVVDQLPSVEELANRLPPEVRTVLDELFRAKWTEVRRLRPEDLQS